MDLSIYYQKIRDFAAAIPEPFPVIVSNETHDGGKKGILTEVTRDIAAKMVVEGLARLAEAAETEIFKLAQAEAQRLAEQAAQAAKVQLAVLSSDEISKLASITKPPTPVIKPSKG